MQNVRVFFRKTGDARFLSHLDVMRCFTRALKRSGFDVWYTQGFNTHIYLMFASPLSLGFESEYEPMDFRINGDEPVTFNQIALKTGRTKARMQQIEQNAFRRLRNSLMEVL